jgi:hypothetical protein
MAPDVREYLESALLARAMLTPDAVPAALNVSPECAFALDVLLLDDCARRGLAAAVACYTPITDLELRDRAWALALVADELTAPDLVTAGNIETIADLLAADRKPSARAA